MAVINQIKATVKINLLYECSSCGIASVGDTIRAELSDNSSWGLKTQIDRIGYRSRYMPVGWSYCDKFHCSKCKGGYHES